jgi:hypothetical protein
VGVYSARGERTVIAVEENLLLRGPIVGKKLDEIDPRVRLIG